MTAKTGRQLGVSVGGERGAALVRNLARRGYRLAVADRRNRADPVDHPLVRSVATLPQLVAATGPDRVLMLLDAAGNELDRLLGRLTPLLDPGDVIVDGGAARFGDTSRRAAGLRATGLRFAGCGITGDPALIEHGPAYVVGGDRAAHARIAPILAATAARMQNVPCVAYAGAAGAGDFALMVHDELAAAEHRLIIEVGTLLRAGLGRSAAQTADVLAGWAGLVPSQVLDAARTVLQRPDPPGWREFGDVLELPVGGDGLPGVRNALDLAVPVTVAAEAVAARTRRWTSTTVPAEPAALLAVTADDIRTGWYAARVVAYAQGFQQLSVAGRAYGWGMDAAAVAGAWRGGTALDGRLLTFVREAFTADPDGHLLADPYFADVIHHALPPWRRVVTAATTAGLPVPAHAAAQQFVTGRLVTGTR